MLWFDYWDKNKVKGEEEHKKKADKYGHNGKCKLAGP